MILPSPCICPRYISCSKFCNSFFMPRTALLSKVLFLASWSEVPYSMRALLVFCAAFAICTYGSVIAFTGNKKFGLAPGVTFICVPVRSSTVGILTIINNTYRKVVRF